MPTQKFFFDDLCIVPEVASALEGYAVIRGGSDWTIDQIYLRHIGGALRPTEDVRLFSLVEEALERDFSKDINGQCGSISDMGGSLPVNVRSVGNAA